MTYDRICHTFQIFIYCLSTLSLERESEREREMGKKREGTEEKERERGRKREKERDYLSTISLLKQQNKIKFCKK